MKFLNSRVYILLILKYVNVLLNLSNNLLDKFNNIYDILNIIKYTKNNKMSKISICLL